MDRGQAHTLEAFTAALLLMSSVVFALQVTAVTPLTASTASQHIENQQGAVAKGVLVSADENETLKPALLYWNETGARFHGATVKGRYTLGGPPIPFGRTLNETFRERGVAFNVNVRFVDSGGNVYTEQLVHFGVPSDNSITESRMVTLYDSDVLYGADGEPTGTTLENASSFYSPDAAPDSPVYNVVEVEVVVWRT